MFLKSCSHFAMAMKPVLNVQLPDILKNYFSPCLHTHAKALSPTAHCKLKAFGWFCAYTCMQQQPIAYLRLHEIGLEHVPFYLDILSLPPQSHDACEQSPQAVKQPCVTI